MIRCDIPDCGAEQPDVGAMAAHFLEDHGLSGAQAMRRARSIAGQSGTQPPGNLDTGVSNQPDAEPPIDATVAEKAVAQQLGYRPDDPLVQKILRENGIEPPTTKPKETPMAAVCKKCGKSGHFAKTCGREDGPAKRTGGGRRTSPKPKPAARASMAAELSTNGTRDNAAKASAKTLLDHLIRLKADLDRRITVVAELVEVL